MDLRAKRKRRIIGSTTTVEAAMRSSGLEPASVVNTCRPHGSVRLFVEEMTYIGHMNEFQLARALRRMIVTSDGRAMGTSMRQRKRQLLEPSMRAE